MTELRDKMRLFHGSYGEVRNPDLSKCAKYRDFGRGFYLTSSEDQARNFTKLSVNKALRRGLIPSQRYGVVSVFQCGNPSELRIFHYPDADAGWLHCVSGHRRPPVFDELVRQMRTYDVISGKIANDNTNVTITAYMRGVFGEIGTEAADRIAISLLLPERLQDQFCFKTEKSLQILTFERSYKVWM